MRQIVFCDVAGRFLGMASPSAITEGLTAEFSVLDEFSRKLREVVSSSDIERETDRQANAWTAFVNASTPVPSPIPIASQAEQAWKVGVRAPLLDRWLGERWINRCIRVERNDLSMSQVQQMVDSLLPDVPLERRKKEPEQGFELLVVDRDAFALELAREWVRSGLPRSPVR